MLSNADVAAKLLEIRTLMELGGESFYKYMAFEKAAASVENAAPLADVVKSGELLKLPGIGKSIGTVVEQLVLTGRADMLDDLYRRFPPSIMEVLAVNGIGVKTAAMLFTTYGIASLADLEKAIAGGVLAGVPRLGPKTIENWKRGILAYKGRKHRTPLAFALIVAREAMDFVLEGPPLDRLTFAGSLRRQEVTVGDVDLICTSARAAEVTAHFCTWARAEAVLAEGPTKASIWLPGGLQIDLRVLPDHLYGNLLQHFTGSREHNIKLREHAVRRGLRVSENGILNLESGDVVTCSEEPGVYEALGMQYVPPELRSGLDEIDLALASSLPVLVEPRDLRGDFHMHTTWSDGDDTLEAMIAAAAARGYEYHAVSDHSHGRGMRYGLTPERLREQRAEIDAIGTRYGICTLQASEVDILPDGSLDFPDDVLAELDLVVASVHTATHQSREEMTSRLIRACRNPYVTIVGHPTGRRFDGSPGYEFDYDAVFAEAARTGTALEIDGQAMRLDLPAPLARKAKGYGVTFTTDSDAHRTGDLAAAELAVGQARRAGLTKEDVLNTRPLDAVLAFIQEKRARGSEVR
ncbi:MAG: DNA polymerase/3'-5' exonuclease PolX [Candidatus Eremiobacteraeota bacterium]|nr:DNA polymerase/3'-5' exonuclease PolX [Candidatus Eremiobacteraeota bacterium]MBV8285241.1 DNA polymerase/3'-5' exonuclease PolX [Candidatus Eremiobacteraeota bacterium]MBV8583631.1 DNA polymerase/3'-5' exonuclease PolX [Candidatus Eremiobacteraeota bacterium]